MTSIKDIETTIEIIQYAIEANNAKDTSESRFSVIFYAIIIGYLKELIAYKLTEQNLILIRNEWDEE